MKHEIRIIKSEQHPNEDVVVENFKLFRNRHGYWCYRFDTPNNKRLLEGMYSTNEVLFQTEKGSSIEITLVPETPEEKEELHGHLSDYSYCIRHLRWQFEVLRVPGDDFYDAEELERFRSCNERRDLMMTEKEENENQN